MDKELEKYRKKIEKIDRQILEKLAERLSVVDLIGVIKQKSQLAVGDKDRERDLKNLYRQWASELRLDFELVKKIFKLVIKESKKRQLCD